MAGGAMEGDFRGFAGDPQSELEVAYLLGLAQEYLPFPLVVTAINDAFPDCEGLDPTTGRRVTIELEVCSRNFLSHGHQIAGCDYIVCWVDNWKDAPAHIRKKIVCLRDLFLEKPALRRKFVDVPRPDSLRAQVTELLRTNPMAHAVVTHFLGTGLLELQGRIPSVTLDDRGTKHFSIRYGSGKGVLGVYPAGKLVAGSVKHMVARYGDVVSTPTHALRAVVTKIGVLTNTQQCSVILEALETVMQAIATIMAKRSGTVEIRPREARANGVDA